MVILDTSIIIDHLRRPPEQSHLLKLFRTYPDEVFAISVVTLQELYEGQSTKNEEREKNLLSLLASLEILPYSAEVAKLAGVIARDLGKPIDLADAAIAATTILSDARLATINTKDFQGIVDLKVV